MAELTVRIGNFTATWEPGDPYIDVRMDGVGHPVHAISTSGDLDESGYPKDDQDPKEYMAGELDSFVREDGADYLSAY